MNTNCQHSKNTSSIGNVKNGKDTWRDYAISKEQAKKIGAKERDVAICNECGAIFDSDTGENMNAREVASYIDDLMALQRVRILEFIEAL